MSDLPFIFTADGWSQEAVSKAAFSAWTSPTSVDGPLALTAHVEEATPDGGTRSRVWPHGEPWPSTMLGRVQRALLDAGVLRSKDQLVYVAVSKTWGPSDSVKVTVSQR